MGCRRWVGTGRFPRPPGLKGAPALRAGAARVRAQLLSRGERDTGGLERLANPNKTISGVK